MRIAYIVVGIIVLLLLFGFLFAFLSQNKNNTLGYGSYGSQPYQAQTYQTVQPASTGCPAGGCTAYQQPVQTSGCPTGCPTAAYAPQQVVYSAPVVYPMYTAAAACPTAAYNSGTWYTSPSYSYSVPGTYSYQYYNPGTYSQTVIPGSYYQVSPGYQQTYQYYNPGYSNGGSYYQQYQYPQQPVYQQPGYSYVQTSASAGTTSNGGTMPANTGGGTIWYH